ncbi:MAG: OmpA family protein [Candidatus Eremiobacteraeota bacterium]|nr:OmpA family protein [Candidatus Eremiobacteraeota bacterium]
MPAIKSAARAHEGRLKKRATEEKLETAGMMRWLLTYADMITLLLALFIILFSISTINKVKLQRLVHDISGGFNSIDAINNPPEGGGLERAQQSQELKQEQQIIQTYIIQKHLEKQVTVRMTNEGLVISLLTDKALYDSGSAQLRPETKALLDQVGTVLRGSHPEVRVEGYTDNEPIHTAAYPTNWELSAARAAGVTRYLVEHDNVDPTKISLAGYGEWRPKHGNVTAEGRQLNRRVDIVIINANVSMGKKILSQSAGAPKAAPKAGTTKISTTEKGH